MTFYLIPLVEGQTEQGCVSTLLQRTWTQLLCRSERLQVVEPFRSFRDKLVQKNGEVLSDCIQKSWVKLQAKVKNEPTSPSLVLILLDAEADCPVTLAPRLLQVAKEGLPGNQPIDCVLAKRMFENWIVAGSSSLASVNDLPAQLPAPDQVEELNGADWLDKQLRTKNPKRKYNKTTDAKAFVRAMNLHDCRKNSPSFDKL